MAFATDLTNRQWALVSDLFDPPGRRGAPALIPRQWMVNAVLYQARTGCQLRYLPAEFGPWGAVWQQFRRWRAKGVWAAAMDRIRRAACVKAGRDPEPSMDMLDSQTAKGGRGGPTFHEAGGKFGATFGAKRTLFVDYLGLPVAARVDSARPHDSRAGRLLCEAVLPNLPRVTDVLADQGFEPLIPGVGRRHHVTVVIKAWKPKPNGFKPLEPLWRVEDCFAQLGRLGHGLAPGRLRRASPHQGLTSLRPRPPDRRARHSGGGQTLLA